MRTARTSEAGSKVRQRPGGSSVPAVAGARTPYAPPHPHAAPLGRAVDLPPGVRSTSIQTERIRLHCLEAGPEDGELVVLVHGIVSTSRWFDHLLGRFPDRYRVLAPDMRSAGATERLPIDATRGMRDWADDLHALVTAEAPERPVHLVGWSAGGAAAATYALEHPLASLTLVAPVPPYGYGAAKVDGSPAFPDFAGSGAALAAPDLVARLQARDRSAESPFSPRNLLAGLWRADDRDAEREEALLDELFTIDVGVDGYPGDVAPSANWPGFAPGSRGLLNAYSPRFCDWSGIVDLDPKPPVLWTYGDADPVISEASPLETGTLGQLGFIAAWPGPDVIPPQPMLTQTRAVLDRYAASGGRVEVEVFAGSGHTPFVDSADAWLARVVRFLDSTDRG